MLRNVHASRMQEYLLDVFNPMCATVFIQQIKENELLYKVQGDLNQENYIYLEDIAQ